MKRILFALIRLCGIPFFFRELYQREKVTIVLFHDITRKNAEVMFGYLRNHYSLIGLQDLLENYAAGTWNFPKKPLIITFDDGHAGNYELLPVIKEMNIPVTVFLCAGIIATRRHFWFTERHPVHSFYVLKEMSNRARLAALAETGFSPEREYEERQALSRQEIEEMAPRVNFQSHTLFHPFLPTCTAEEAEQEIAGSKSVLEQQFGLRITAFSYPNGDYSGQDIGLCKKAGYLCGITLDPGCNTAETDVFRLRRLSVNDTDDINELAVKASGFWGMFRSFFGIRNGFFRKDRQ